MHISVRLPTYERKRGIRPMVNKLLILLLLLAPVAKADSFQFFISSAELDFQAPAGSFQVNQYTFVPSIPYYGGIISADFYPIEQESNYFVGYFLLGQLVAYPADFQFNTDAMNGQQWPWDVGNNTSFAGYEYPDQVQAQSLSVTTPEPATWLLVLPVGLLIGLVRLLWKSQ